MTKIELNYKDVVRTLLLFGLVIITSYLVFLIFRYWPQINDLLNPKQTITSIEKHFRTRSFLNFVVLTFLTSLATAIPFLSNSILGFFNGLVFGSWLGFLMNLLGAVFGNVLLSQLLAHVHLHEKDHKTNQRMAKLSQLNNPYVGLTLAYMIPFIPAFLANYSALEMKIPWSKWLICVILGVLPSSFVYAFGGDAIFKGNWHHFLILIFLLLVLVGLYYSWDKRKKESAQNRP